jgi:hypothetical protein
MATPPMSMGRTRRRTACRRESRRRESGDQLVSASENEGQYYRAERDTRLSGAHGRDGEWSRVRHAFDVASPLC